MGVRVYRRRAGSSQSRLAQGGRQKKERQVLTFKRLGAVAVVIVALAVPAAAAAQGQDLRNPDQQFPAQERTQDLRSPDRRAPAPVEAVQAPAVTAIEVPADGFDWGDAGIGAAGGVALVAMLASLAMAGIQHRRGQRITA